MTQLLESQESIDELSVISNVPETTKIDFSNTRFLRRFNINSDIRYRINLTWDGGVVRIIEPTGVFRQIKDYMESVFYSQTDFHPLTYEILSDDEKKDLHGLWDKVYQSLPPHVKNFQDQFSMQLKQFNERLDNSKNDKTGITNIQLYSFDLEGAVVPKNLIGSPRTVIERLERKKLAESNKWEKESTERERRFSNYVERTNLPGNIECIALGSDDYAEFDPGIERTYEIALSGNLINFYKSLIMDDAIALEHRSWGSELPDNLRKIRYRGTFKNNKSIEVVLDFDNQFESYAYGNPTEGEIAPVQFNSMALGFRHKRQMPFDYSKCNGKLLFEREVVRATSDQNYSSIQVLPKASDEYDTYMVPRVNQKLSGNTLADKLVLDHRDAVKQIVAKYDKSVKSNF